MDGTITGLDYAAAEAICDGHGWEWRSVLPLLQAGEAGMMSGLIKAKQSGPGMIGSPEAFGAG